MKNKIYFSKSNAVAKETADKIHKYILKFDVDLKEFSGGSYTNSVMDDCEFLIVLPPHIAKKKPGISEAASVGRGIFQQTQYFYNKKKEICNILIITGYGLCDNKDISYIEFSNPSYWHIKDETNYVNYGEIELKRNNLNMRDIFPTKKSTDADSYIEYIFDMTGSARKCNITEHKVSKVTARYIETPAWDDVYEEWFTEPIKGIMKLEPDDLVINPDDHEDYSLLLTM
jgi:hypothetical protein